MPDCFISYASPDEAFARYFAQFLEWQGLHPFMAKLSLSPGEEWSQETRAAHKSSPWVVFLASRSASASPSVQQEVGGAVFSGKNLVPVVWDMAPEELPGWAKEYQALDLRGMQPQAIQEAMYSVAGAIRGDRSMGRVIALGLLAALALFLLTKE